MPEYQFLGSVKLKPEQSDVVCPILHFGGSTVFSVPHGDYIDYLASPPIPPDIAAVVRNEFGIGVPHSESEKPAIIYDPPSPSGRGAYASQGSTQSPLRQNSGEGFYRNNADAGANIATRHIIPYMQRGKIPGGSHLVGKR